MALIQLHSNLVQNYILFAQKTNIIYKSKLNIDVISSKCTRKKLTFQGFSQISPIKSKSTWEKWYQNQRSFKIKENWLHNSFYIVQITFGINFYLSGSILS